MSEWLDAEHVRKYLERADEIPRRSEGELTLLEEVPSTARCVLDPGSGDGRLLALILEHAPEARGVALDFSAGMLARLRERFPPGGRVEVVEHDLAKTLPALGSFDVVSSSFAIHHLEHPRKRALYEEVWRLLEPAGVFLNLEHVSSPTPLLHARFLEAMGSGPADEDPSNKLLDVETQLRWLREIGFEDVDCLWKWRELALLRGSKPAGG